MPKALLFAPETFNFAEVTRCIEVARRLPEFRCVFAGFSERFASPIREAGFDYRPLTPVLTDAEGEMAMAFDQGRGLRHPFTVDMVRQRVVSERAQTYGNFVLVLVVLVYLLLAKVVFDLATPILLF